MIQKISRDKTLLALVLSSIVIFFIMLYFNCMTTLNADDFSYSYNWITGRRLVNLSDIIQTQYNHYFTQNGRIAAHSIAQLFLLVGKPVFNVANSLMYLCFTWLVYYLIKGYKRHTLSLFFLIHLAVWIFDPVYGDTIFWLIGSCNYMWGTTILLTFLLPFRLYFENQRICTGKIWIPLMIILGFLAGECSENGSAAMLLLAAMLAIFLIIRKIRLPLWSYVGLLSCFAGYLFMILAPGNTLRSAGFEQSGSFFHEILQRFILCTNVLGGYYFIPIAAFAVAFTLMIILKAPSQDMVLPVVSFCAALSANYAMILSPYYPTRASFCVLVLFILSVGICLSSLSRLSIPWARRVQTLLVTVMAISFTFTFFYAVLDAASSWVQSNKRIAYVEEQKKLGNYMLVVPEIIRQTKYNGISTDISPDMNYWVNVGFSNYYGLQSIVSENTQTDWDFSGSVTIQK